MRVLLRLAAWEAWRRPGHTAILVAAIVVGVALVTAVQAVNHATLSSLEEAVAALAGEAQLQVRARGDNVPEAMIEQVRSQPGVSHASALVSGTLWITAGPAEGETLSVFGIDLGDDASVRTYRVAHQSASDIIDDPIEFLAQPDSVVLSDDLMSRFGLRRGERLAVLGPLGPKTLTVRGSLAPDGVGHLFGGALAVMDLFAAERLLARDHVVDQIDVVVLPGARAETVKAQLQASLPSGFEVIAPEQRGAATERILRAFTALLTGFSALGLFFGTFVSYNLAATTISARLGELGMLRCVGASRRQMRIFALAAVALPALGASVIGVGLGAILAPGLVQPLAHTISYGARLSLHVRDATVPPMAVPLALLAGLGAALVGAWRPAAAAARIAPRQIGQVPESAPSGRLIRLGLVAVGAAAVGLATAVATESALFAGVAILLINVALALLSLAALPWLRVPLDRLLALAGGHGRIAADALARAPLRAGVTVTVVSMALAMVLTLGCVTASFKGSVLDYLKSLVAADLIVTSPFHEEAWIESPIAQAIADEVQTVPGVERTATERFVNVIRDDERITIHAVDQAFFEDARFGRWLFHAGDPASAVLATATGQAVLVSDNLARRHGLRIGDPFTLDTPGGPLALPVAGIVTEYVSETGTVIMQRATYARLWYDTMVNRVFVLAGHDTAAEEVRSAIGRRFVGRFPLRMLTASEFRARFERELDGVFAFLVALRGLMMVLAILGVADTLLGLGLARAREMGVLRAIGMRRRGVYGLFALEAAALSGVGIVLGIAGALVLSTIWVRVSLTYQLGWQLNVYLPWVQYGLLALATWLLSALAALLPVRGIARRPPAELLAYE